VFADYPGVETDSAGLTEYAEVPLSSEQVEWADIVIVMEKVHRKRLNQKFGKALKGKRIAVLGIPDDYTYMDPELVELLKARCRRYLP
jgi:predicted protein tyrosine phosphatase